jgi:hypothetical protein
MGARRAAGDVISAGRDADVGVPTWLPGHLPGLAYVTNPSSRGSHSDTAGT